MNSLVRLAVGVVGVVLALGGISTVVGYAPVALSARLKRVELHDPLFLSDTRRSHFLLPDGRLRVEVGDPAVHRRDADAIARLSPDPADRQAVLAWGRELFEACRGKHRAYLRNLDDLAGGGRPTSAARTCSPGSASSTPWRSPTTWPPTPPGGG